MLVLNLEKYLPLPIDSKNVYHLGTCIPISTIEMTNYLIVLF